MILQTIIVFVYTGSLLLILMYAIAQLNLLINYLRAKKKIANCPVFDFKNPEEIPVDEVEFLPELIALHKNLIELFRTRQWWQCLELVAVLHGRWNGIADNFYASVLERIEMYADNPPPETWLGEFWEPESNTT